MIRSRAGPLIVIALAILMVVFVTTTAAEMLVESTEESSIDVDDNNMALTEPGSNSLGLVNYTGAEVEMTTSAQPIVLGVEEEEIYCQDDGYVFQADESENVVNYYDVVERANGEFNPALTNDHHMDNTAFIHRSSSGMAVMVIREKTDEVVALPIYLSAMAPECVIAELAEREVNGGQGGTLLVRDFFAGEICYYIEVAGESLYSRIALVCDRKYNQVENENVGIAWMKA